MVAKALHNFHLPLPQELYVRLQKEARARSQSLTGLVRVAIYYWLKQKRRMSLHREIAAYAEENAGTPCDIDAELESAAVLCELKEFCEEKGYKQSAFVEKALREQMEREELKDDVFDLINLRPQEILARPLSDYVRARK